jgi:hypothetical protein
MYCKKRFECLRRTLKGWNLNIEGGYKRKREALGVHLMKLIKVGVIWANTFRNRGKKKLLQNQLKNIIK